MSALSPAASMSSAAAGVAGGDVTALDVSIRRVHAWLCGPARLYGVRAHSTVESL